MLEKKTTSKKKPVSQVLAAVSPPAPEATSSTAAASSSLPPVSEESLVKLIALATSSPNLSLGLIWKHAFEQGSQEEGFKRGTAPFKDMDVKQEFQDGADQGQIVGILAEREEWETAGHGQWCFDKPLTCVLCDIGICEEHIKLNVSVQVDIVGPPPPPSSTEATIQVTPSLHSSSPQTNPPPLLIYAEAQAQLTDSAPAPTTAFTQDPPAFDWSEDAASIPIIPIYPKNQSHCDLSPLCTTNPNPFSSLAHWNCHSQLPLEDHNSSGPWPPFQPH